MTMKLPAHVRNEFLKGTLFLSITFTGLMAAGVLNGETPARKASTPPPVVIKPSTTTTGSSQPDAPYAWWEDNDSANVSRPDAKDMLPKRWSFISSISAGYEYDDNLTLDKSEKTGSGFLTVQPTLGVKYGPMASGLTMDLIYTADLEWYLDNDLGDRVNHDVSSSFSWERGPFRLFGSLGYGSQASADIDAGDRVARDGLDTSLGLTYEHSEKTTLGITYSTELFNPEDESYISSNTQTFGAFADYKVTGKTTLGLGAQYEYQQVGQGSDSNAYRLLLRSTWAATSKLTLRGEAGPELREYTDSDSGMDVYWNLGIDYKLVDTGKTSFAFDIYRDQQASSSLANQAYTSTGVSGTLTFTPAESISLNMATGFEYASYTGTSSEVTADRQDNLYFFRPSLTYAIGRRASVSLYYQWTQNVSDGEQSVDFDRNSYGALFTLTY